MIDPYEIQARLNDMTSGLAEKIGREVGSHTVALLAVSGSGEAERLQFVGTGTLVSIASLDYILTAAHVWEWFVKNNAVGIGLTLEEDVDHRFFISVKSIVASGPEKVGDWNPWGPDITLLKIPAEFADTLKKVKRFHTLATESPVLPNVDSLEVWMLMGSPAAQGTFTEKHASLTMNGIFATIRCQHNHGGFDYIDLDMDVTFPGVPRRFGGVSGGGLWRVFIYGATDGEIRWILTLMGVAFYELELVNNIRPVRCHGEQSIRAAISSVGRASLPTKSTIIANTAAPSPSHNKFEKTRCPKTPWWKTAAELLGIAAVVAYTIVSYFQWDTAHRQLEATERPWLKVNFTPESVTFQDGGMQFSMSAHITNVGHSVATGVIVPIKMFLVSDENGIFKEPLKRQEELCDAIADKPVSARRDETAIAIFPDSSDNSLLLGSGFSKSEIASTPTANPNFAVKHILPIIVGCVDYQYGVSTHHHQTRFIYEVQRLDPATPPNIFSIEVGGNVPAPNVVLVPYAFGGFLAN